MKRIKKSLLACFALGMIISLSGCSNSDKDSKKDSQGTTKQEDKIQMVANDVYVEPVNPTNAQIKAYNALSDAVKSENLEEEAKQVAISFVYDFYTLSNKTDQGNLGGLEFIPSTSIGSFEDFATSYYYGNYPTIVNTYGKDSLPEVSGVTISSAIPQSYLTYGTQSGEGYVFTIQVTYADSKMPSDKLKTNIEVTVMRMYDYPYDSSIDYSSAYTQAGSPIELYRVLAAE